MTPPRTALIDYGAGNLRSVAKALTRSGLDVAITSDAGAIRDADAVVLPGAGAFADAMEHLRAKGLVDTVREKLAAGGPYLGLCLGLQLLFEESEEHGLTAGFAVIEGRVERFATEVAPGERRRVPHIGWNAVRFSGDHPMLRALPAEDYYYFVHAYHAVPKDPGVVVGRADYHGEFAAAVASEGVFAVQFHPEKSQAAGKRLIDAFATWVRES
ncbi:MAG: imidazole glycerol phosphate synthase subunit HisH [Myxococcales bacterium]|nr:imidazole glycerol phosphate synthase subunit HisH [Myxococcales bacterium]